MSGEWDAVQGGLNALACAFHRAGIRSDGGMYYPCDTSYSCLHGKTIGNPA
jgi:hypothetical protein